MTQSEGICRGGYSAAPEPYGSGLAEYRLVCDTAKLIKK